MIHFHIDEKLALLANSEEELIEIYKQKLLQQAKENDHCMSDYIIEGDTYLFNFVNHHSYCKRCKFTINIELIASFETTHYYSLGDNINDKCSGI